MLGRLAFFLAMSLGPRIIPRVVRTAYLVWKLSFDRRVPLLLRLLTPATLIYFVHPLSRIPIAGLIGYLVILGLAVLLLLNLAPKHVVESYAPWRVKPHPPGEGNRSSANVVEGTGHVLDEDEAGK